MPALPNVSKVVKLDFLFSLISGIPALSRQYYHYSGTAPTLSDLEGFTSNAVAAFAGDCIAAVPSDYTFLGVEGTDLSTPTSPQTLQSVTTPGTRTEVLMPQDVAFVCTYGIARRYRGGHPRGYWPFGNANDLVDERTWDPAAVTEFTDDLVSMQTAITSGGWSGSTLIEQVSVSYYHGFTVIVDPSTGRARNKPTLRGVPLVDTVQQLTGQSRLGTQRRRLGR